MRRAAVLLNRDGGALAAASDLPGRVATALREAGVDAELSLVDGGEIEEQARAAAGRGHPLLIVGGGDGSIGAAAGALAGSETALGILPLGTLNHFARDLGIPADLGEAAALIAFGNPRRVDIAEVNGRTFINNAAIGLYPLMVLDRDAQRKRLGRSKRLAMLVASVRTLARFRHQRLTLTVNRTRELLDTPLLLVGNNDYRVVLPAAGQRDRLDDGQLCVLVMRSKTRLGFAAATFRALVGRTRGDDMERIDGVEDLRVGSRRSHLTVAMDGEVTSMAPPLDFSIRKGALTVIAPEPAE